MGTERDIEIALCVFREANDALLLFDPRDRRVVDVNPAALRLTGFERKALLALKVADLLSSPDPNDIKRLLAAFQQTSFFHSQEGYFLSRMDKPPIPINVSVSRIHTAPEPLGLAIIRDISERKKVEAELREARDELESRVQGRTAELARANQDLRAEIADRLRAEGELRQAKEAAESASQAKDRFLAVLSHELRTPLTPVLAVASALLEGTEAPPSLRPSLEMIRRSISLESRLIDDLLDVIQAGKGQLRLEIEPVNLHTLIEQAIEAFQRDAEEAGVRVATTLRAREPMAMADPARIQQVVWNLLHNALKFTQKGGSIEVETGNTDGGRHSVTVTDTGRGIEPDLLRVIFEPFEQGSTSIRRRLGGLGVGLSISRSIVEGHGGQLAASSDGAGRGAAFTFDLAVATISEAALQDMSGANTPATDETAAPAVSILLVDDNKDVLRFLKLVLEMKGHPVRTAIDLESARGALDQPFDLLISDIELPDGSGLELMRELRGRAPGIAISGFGAADDIQMSLAAGFSRHLIKPIDSKHLEAAIKEVVAESGRKQAGTHAP